MKKLQLEVAGEIIEVSFRLDGQDLVFSRTDDETERRFSVEEQHGDQLVLSGPSGRQKVAAIRDGDRVHVALGAEPFQLRRHIPDPTAEGPNAATADLLAPMTGKVVKVLAEVGAHLQAGDAVVIVEAMKMEHKLSAPFDAVLATLSVVEGQQVDMNEKLAHLERIDEENLEQPQD